MIGANRSQKASLKVPERMTKLKPAVVTAAVLVILPGGLGVMSVDGAGDAGERPVVRVAIGMDPGEVMRRSTYPLAFSGKGQPFPDPPFRYGDVIVTADVDLDVLEPHRVLFEHVRYWGIRTEFDDVVHFSADAPFLTLDEALERARTWGG